MIIFTYAIALHLILEVNAEEFIIRTTSQYLDLLKDKLLTRMQILLP